MIDVYRSGFGEIGVAPDIFKDAYPAPKVPASKENGHEEVLTDLQAAIKQHEAAMDGKAPFPYPYEHWSAEDTATMIANCNAALAGEGWFHQCDLRKAGSDFNVRLVEYFPAGKWPEATAVEMVKLEGYTFVRGAYWPVDRSKVKTALVVAQKDLEAAAEIAA